jgi:hypothetical protein
MLHPQIQAENLLIAAACKDSKTAAQGIENLLIAAALKGGEGSGNWGHESVSRVGKVGGSDPGGGLASMGLTQQATVAERQERSAYVRQAREGPPRQDAADFLRDHPRAYFDSAMDRETQAQITDALRGVPVEHVRGAIFSTFAPPGYLPAKGGFFLNRKGQLAAGTYNPYAPDYTPNVHISRGALGDRDTILHEVGHHVHQQWRTRATAVQVNAARAHAHRTAQALHARGSPSLLIEYGLTEYEVSKGAELIAGAYALKYREPRVYDALRRFCLEPDNGLDLEAIFAVPGED